MDPWLPLTTHARGSYSPPHESFKGSVEEWRSLTARQRFEINNPGREKDQKQKIYAKKKEMSKERLDNPINKAREQQKQYRIDNREKLKERRDDPIYKEKQSERGKQYRIDNRENWHNKTMEWRKNNPKKQKENDKKWRDDNPDKCRAARLRCDLKKQKNFNVMFHEIY
jgi:hypothetical protein